MPDNSQKLVEMSMNVGIIPDIYCSKCFERHWKHLICTGYHILNLGVTNPHLEEEILHLPFIIYNS